MLSISKQRGAEMSSRLMPPKAGAIFTTVLDDLFCILCIKTDWEGIYPAKLLKENSLSFHNRHSCLGTDIAQSQYGTSVGDNGNRCWLSIGICVSLLPCPLRSLYKVLPHRVCKLIARSSRLFTWHLGVVSILPFHSL